MGFSCIIAHMGGSVPDEVETFMQAITTEIINPILAVIFAATLLYFLYGLMIFIVNTGDEAKRNDGKRHLTWSLVGMAVMLSVYTILQIGLRTFGVTGDDLPQEIPITTGL